MKKNPFLEHFLLPQKMFSPTEKLPQDISFGGVTLPESTIYLDFAASTPLDRRIFAAMEPWSLGYFGNASSLHPLGEISRHGISQARAQVAEAVGMHFEEVFFTGSATESNNLVLRGLVEHPLRRRTNILYSATEHSSIAATARQLAEHYAALGIKAIELPVDKNGQIILSEANALIDQNTLCVCVMDVNNETGIVQSNSAEIAFLAQKAGAHFHMDSVQGFARQQSFSGQDVPFDTCVLSSGKIYGPRGVAALLVRKKRPKIKIIPQLSGGGQESGLRSGTHNVAAIIGFAAAISYQNAERKERFAHYQSVEDAFCQELSSLIDAQFFGRDVQKAPGIVSLFIPGVNAMKLLEQTKTVCASVGSACRTLQATPNRVLLAMGVDLDIALSSFRVSFGLTNTEEEVRVAAQRIALAARRLRETSASLG